MHHKFPCGVDNPNSKLTAADKEEIQVLLDDGAKRMWVARRFGITKAYLRQLVKQLWPHLVLASGRPRGDMSDAPESKNYCLGCLAELSGDSISLDGYEQVLCKGCWDGMRPFERALLTILSTTGFDSRDGSGLGVGYELSNIDSKLDEILKKMR